MNATVIILPVAVNSAKSHQKDLLASALTKELGLALVILRIAKMLPIRFAGTLTCHSVPVSKELETARDTAATTVTVTTPLADVKCSPLPLPEVHVDAHTKGLGHAVGTRQLVRTRPHGTALNQTQVLSHVCKEEEIAVDMMCVIVIITREVALS